MWKQSNLDHIILNILITALFIRGSGIIWTEWYDFSSNSAMLLSSYILYSLILLLYAFDILLSTDMPVTKCAAKGCPVVLHCYAFPSKTRQPKRHHEWVKFVRQTNPNFVASKSSRLCWRHFETSGFTNWTGYQARIYNK